MSLQLYTLHSFELQEIVENTLSIQTELTNEDIEELMKYQEYICMQLEWIELDKQRLHHLIELLFIHRVLHHSVRMKYLRKAIKTYYYLRRHFTISYTDDELTSILVYSINKQPDLSFQELFEILESEIKKEGGVFRDDQSFFTL